MTNSKKWLNSRRTRLLRRQSILRRELRRNCSNKRNAYDFALETFKTGKSLLAFDLNNVGVKDLLVIIYCGFCYEDKNLTPEQVGDLIDDYSSISKIAEKLGEALTVAFGADAMDNGDKSGEK